MTLCSDEENDGEHLCAWVQEMLLCVPVPKMNLIRRKCMLLFLYMLKCENNVGYYVK